MAGFTYKSYSFLEKDPIIDQIRTLYNESGANYSWIKAHSGVSPKTLSAWFVGSTKRPQAASINAVLRSLGHKLSITPMNKKELSGDEWVWVTRDDKRPESAWQTVAMAHYRKAK